MNDLKYWKARKIDADLAVEQAREHLILMINCQDYAARKIEAIEDKILVRNLT